MGILPRSKARVGASIDVTRHGILPNDIRLAGSNTAALRKLLDPAATDGPRGRVLFPSATGNDVYHFNDTIEVRDGIDLDLCWSRLRFSKHLTAADRGRAFLQAIRDVRILNGEIDVSVTGNAVNGGSAVMFGSRWGMPFGPYTSGVFDLTDLIERGAPPMGNCWLQNLRITSNNPGTNSAALVVMVGGLRGGGARELTLIGDLESGAPSGIYYEFGFASKNGRGNSEEDFPHWSSSHARDLEFDRVRAENLQKNVTSDAHAVVLVEAWSARCSHIHSRNCYGSFQYRVGEAHMYRPWIADDRNARREIVLRQISSQGASGVGILLNAAQSVSGGYLHDRKMELAKLPPLTTGQQADLMRFSLDGFSLAAGTGMVVDGVADIRNGVVRGCFNGINVSGDCRSASFVNVDVMDSTSNGFRANTQSSLIPAHKKELSIEGSRICGSHGPGISLDWVQRAEVNRCQIGYNKLFDGRDERTQTVGVAVSSDASNVRCAANHVTTSGGAVAYAIQGPGPRGCKVEDPKGTVTSSGFGK